MYRLQLIDSRLDQVRSRIREIELALSNHTTLLEMQEIARSAEQDYLDAQKYLRKTEDTTQDQRIKIIQTESVLYGGKVRNPKELQDLQNDVAALKRYLNVLEDRQLEAMLALENAEDIVKQAHIKLDKTQALIIEQQSGMKGELSLLLKTVERLEIERQAAVTAVIPADINLYEQLRKTRRGVAVAIVSAQACGACGSHLTPALVQEASSPTQLIRCTSCGRILYVG